MRERDIERDIEREREREREKEGNERDGESVCVCVVCESSIHSPDKH